MRTSLFSLASIFFMTAAITPPAVHAQTQQPGFRFERDDALHFGVSLGLAGAGYAASVALVREPWQRALIGGGVALGLGIGKEVLDALGFGDPSWRDFGFDVIGVALGVGLALAIDYTVRALRKTATEPASSAAAPLTLYRW